MDRLGRASTVPGRIVVRIPGYRLSSRDRSNAVVFQVSIFSILESCGWLPPASRGGILFLLTLILRSQ